MLLSGLIFRNVLAKSEKRVLFISSYHPGFPTFFQQVDGIKSIFSKHPIIFDVEFMDSKRLNDDINLKNFVNCYIILRFPKKSNF